MTTIGTGARAKSLRACDFPVGTPLHEFFRWNEARWIQDRRYTVARDLYHLYSRFNADGAGDMICVSHLAIRPVIRWRSRSRILVSLPALENTAGTLAGSRDTPAVMAARRLVESLLASIGTNEPEYDPP